MTKAAKFFKRRASSAKGTGLLHFLVSAPDVVAKNEAWIAKRRKPSQERIDNAMAILNRKGTLPPAPDDEVPESYKAWEREQAGKGRKAG